MGFRDLCVADLTSRIALAACASSIRIRQDSTGILTGARSKKLPTGLAFRRTGPERLSTGQFPEKLLKNNNFRTLWWIDGGFR
jgi:hypothetical protein